MSIGHPTASMAILAALLLAACGAKEDKTATEAATGEPAAATPAPTGTAQADTPAGQPPSETAALPPTAGSNLAAYVGKYPFDKVDGVAWNDNKLVKAGIAAAVKDPAALKAITTLDGPSAPIEMKDGKVMAWACEAHNCGPHQWAVLVDPRTSAIDVCYFNEEADAAKSRWFLATGKEEKRDGNCQGSN